MTRDDEIRAQLLNALRVIQPYARSTGQFHNVADLRAAITLARQYLERAQHLADRRLPGNGGLP
jgi:hypothetical protein